MTTWKIEYIDTKSRGKRLTTYHTGNLSKEAIIAFFGLDEPDVIWYRVTKQTTPKFTY